MEHSAILSAFVKLSFIIKLFVLFILEWPPYTGFCLCNSSTMTCPPVCGDNPRILASGCFCVQVTNIVQLHVFHTTYIGVSLAHPGAFQAKVGKSCEIVN